MTETAEARSGVLIWGKLKREDVVNGVIPHKFRRVKFGDDFSDETLLSIRRFIIASRLSCTRSVYAHRVLAPCVADFTVDSKIRQLVMDASIIELPSVTKLNGCRLPFSEITEDYQGLFGEGIRTIPDYYRQLADSKKSFLLHPLQKEILVAKLTKEIELLKNVEVLAEYLSTFWFFGESSAHYFLNKHLYEKYSGMGGLEKGPGAPMPVKLDGYRNIEEVDEAARSYRERMVLNKRYTLHQLSLIDKKAEDFNPGDFRFEFDAKFGRELTSLYSSICARRMWDVFRSPKTGSSVEFDLEKFANAQGLNPTRICTKEHYQVMRRIAVSGWDSLVKSLIQQTRRNLGMVTVLEGAIRV